MEFPGPFRAHPSLRRKRVVAGVQLAVGALFCGLGGLLLVSDVEGELGTTLAAFAAGAMGLLAGVSGCVVASKRGRQAATLRGGGTVTALPILSRAGTSDGGWTLVCEHDGAEHAFTLFAEDGWPLVVGAGVGAGVGGSHLAVFLPATDGPPVPLSESGFPLGPSPEEFGAWAAAARAAAARSAGTEAGRTESAPRAADAAAAAPWRPELPVSLKGLGAVPPHVVAGLVLLGLFALCDPASIPGAVCAVAFTGLLVSVFRRVRAVDVRGDRIEWTRRVGRGRIDWEDVGGIAVRPSVRRRGSSDSGAIVAGVARARLPDVATGVVERIAEDDDGPAGAPGAPGAVPRERPESEDPVLARLEHLGARDPRREPEITLLDQSGDVAVRFRGGVSWRHARVLLAEAAARGIAFR